ncbi:MAG: hypothetical protein H0X37_22695 [Herpetosiphonaceae bacterium]|nr:hypothetical protein [Herpetosiphonaceae bacterium]
MNYREDGLEQRRDAPAGTVSNVPQQTLDQVGQDANTSDADDATSVTGGTDQIDTDQPVTAAESMIEADLDNPRTHER